MKAGTLARISVHSILLSVPFKIHVDIIINIAPHIRILKICLGRRIVRSWLGRGGRSSKKLSDASLLLITRGTADSSTLSFLRTDQGC